MEYEFRDDSPLERLPKGSRISLQRLFSLMDGVEDDPSEVLDRRHISLDVENVPLCTQGEAAERLKLEHSLAHAGRIPGGLDPDDPLRIYWNEMKQLPRLDQEGILTCVKAGKDPTEGLMWLALEEAPAFAGQGILMLDLLQEGAMGLIAARDQLADTLNPLEAARWYVREYMARSVAMQFLVTGEGERLMASMRAYQQADRRLLRQLGRNPLIEELAREMGKTVEEVESIRKMVTDAAASPKSGTPAEENLQEQEERVEDSASFRIRTLVEELLSDLEPMDRDILTLRFGLEGKRPQTVEETAQSLGLTPTEVGQRELAAMQKLQKR